MLEDKNVIWGELENSFKEGVFIRRQTYEKKILGKDNKNTFVTRSFIGEIELKGKFNTITNRENFIFDKEDPIFNSG